MALDTFKQVREILSHDRNEKYFDKSKLDIIRGFLKGVTVDEEIDSPVLNPVFHDYRDWIEWNLQTRLAAGGQRYEYHQKEQKLLGACKRHAESHQRPITADKVLFLVHPFYLILSHMHHVETDEMHMEINEYIFKILSLFQKRSPENLGIVLLDTIHHYAAVSSLLLEKAHIDQVIFTLHDDGIPLVPNELYQYKDRVVYIGGGYNCGKNNSGGCFVNTIDIARREIPNIIAVKDLTFNSPRHNEKRLKPTEIKKGQRNGFFHRKEIVDSTRLHVKDCIFRKN